MKMWSRYWERPRAVWLQLHLKRHGKPRFVTKLRLHPHPLPVILPTMPKLNVYLEASCTHQVRQVELQVTPTWTPFGFTQQRFTSCLGCKATLGDQPHRIFTGSTLTFPSGPSALSIYKQRKIVEATGLVVTHMTSTHALWLWQPHSLQRCPGTETCSVPVHKGGTWMCTHNTVSATPSTHLKSSHWWHP